jgi:Tfp pilus assembly protein PilX
MRSSSRARTRERGYVLISAVVLAVLYFGLMELLLIDSTRALREAQRFRSKIISATLAESAAELAAAQLVTQIHAEVHATDPKMGTMEGSLRRTETRFELHGIGECTGVPPTKATVDVQGALVGGTHIRIDYTKHSW